jgi:hypothetical protein
VVCNNTQVIYRITLVVWFSTQEYPFPWRSVSIGGLFWPSKKSLALKVIQDFGGGCANFGADWTSFG